MPEIDRIVRDNFVRVLSETGFRSRGIDIDLDMAREYGLTSLNKILFITAVCDEAHIDLFRLTEQDLVKMRTTRDVIDALTRVANEVQ